MGHVHCIPSSLLKLHGGQVSAERGCLNISSLRLDCSHPTRSILLTQTANYVKDPRVKGLQRSLKPISWRVYHDYRCFLSCRSVSALSVVAVFFRHGFGKQQLKLATVPIPLMLLSDQTQAHANRMVSHLFLRLSARSCLRVLCSP